MGHRHKVSSLLDESRLYITLTRSYVLAFTHIICFQWGLSSLKANFTHYQLYPGLYWCKLNKLAPVTFVLTSPCIKLFSAIATMRHDLWFIYTGSKNTNQQEFFFPYIILYMWCSQNFFSTDAILWRYIGLCETNGQETEGEQWWLSEMESASRNEAALAITKQWIRKTQHYYTFQCYVPLRAQSCWKVQCWQISF